MAAEQAEGVLEPGEAEPKQPSEVAAELDAADKNLTDAPAALREDQVQNAVAFLAHPKVRTSSEESKRAFLERKGLTAAEIKEAVSRVADAGAAAPTAIPAGLPSAAPRKPFQASIPAQPVSYLPQQPPVQQSTGWSQVVIGASIVAAGAYALKQLLGPYAIRWYHRLYGIEEPPEPQSKAQDDQRTGELLAAAISAQTKELREALEGLKGMMKQIEEKQQLEGAQTAAARDTSSSLTVSDLRAELHAFAATLGSLDSRPEGAAEVSEQLVELRSLLLAERSIQAASKGSAAATPPEHTGQQLPNGKHTTSETLSPESSSSPEAIRQQSPSYQEVVEMLERGETPSNVRTDIDDKPPRPAMSPPSARMEPRRKPWERKQPGSSPGSADESSSTPGPSGVTITELDDSPSPSKPGRGSWKPPPAPQASLKLASSKSEPSAKEAAAADKEGGDEAES